jgi:hypothetical protein
MADSSVNDQIRELVGTLVENVAGRLSATANDAQRRQELLLKAKKDSGNRLRSDEIGASLHVEGELALDARALAKRLTPVKRSIEADLERLISVARDSEPPDAA